MSFSLPSSPKIKSKFRSNNIPSTIPSPPITPVSVLPSSHPLIAELTSLRQQLSQYQKAAHQASIQLQGARLELALSKENQENGEREKEVLKKEVDVLRSNPIPPSLIQDPSSSSSSSSASSAIRSSSNALTELSLAHRRLSSKLDLTENELSITKLDYNKLKIDFEKLKKEREGDRSVINELKRIEDDREEELEWEKGERKKLEEQKKLCDLALAEYSTLVHSLDPAAVPPQIPSKVTSSIFHAPSLQRLSVDGEDSSYKTDSINLEQKPSTANDSPALTSLPTIPPTTTSQTSSGEIISNLLIGQKGVQQLFNDFTSFLTSKDKHINSLESKIEESEHSYKITQEQLDIELKKRVEAENEKDKVLRNDESASKVIERYMIFTQKTHQNIYNHLNNLRIRYKTTTESLKTESLNLKTQLIKLNEKNNKLLVELDTLNENYLKESTGRRREIHLRLKLLNDQEKYQNKVNIWLNKVKLLRDSPGEFSVVENDVLESLLDEAIEAISIDSDTTSSRDTGSQREKIRSWRGIGALMNQNKNPSSNKYDSANQVERNPEEESLARILLAEELVTTLVADLQIETEKRMELERQRVEWLAKDAIQGVNLDEDREHGEDGHVMFDLEDHEEQDRKDDKSTLIPTVIVPEPLESTVVKTENEAFVLEEEDDNLADKVEHLQLTSNQTELLTPVSPLAEPSPLISQLKMLFEPMTNRYEPLQKTLHDLSYSLTTLKDNLPVLETPNSINTTSPRSTKKSHFLTLAKLPIPEKPKPSNDPIVLNLLDELHEVIEDAKVDVEIDLADHERVYRGFEALLNVNNGKTSSTSKNISKEEIMDEVREYVEVKGNDNDKSSCYIKLKSRIENIEFDLMKIKSVIHELDGMELSHDLSQKEEIQEEEEKSKNIMVKGKKSIWDDIQLKTISIPNSNDIQKKSSSSFFGFSPISPISTSTISSPLHSPSLVDGLPTNSSNGFNLNMNIDPVRRTSNMFSTVGNVSRSFSSSVIGAPRKVSNLAGGFYRPGSQNHNINGNTTKTNDHLPDEEQHGLLKKFDEDDDVE
ncbi:uncharacterized protein L201_007089 [Kwoniella dendrophila CBS 6074]|uniref:Uncharacterized protein n=1 Tax=Kwoniella dendrophila CBS 6074 TaxID=1295534 RepID=A0AAX4K5S7_9TREE